MFNEGRRAAWIEVRLDRIAANYRALRGLAEGSAMIAAIKADAYGLGAVKVAWELVRGGVEYLGVATISEAVTLREAGIRVPIVLFGATPRGNVKDIIDLGILPVITTREDAALLDGTAKSFAPGRRVDVLCALETGMGRLGFLRTREGLAHVCEIAAMPNLRLLGLHSHFASADAEDPSFTLAQIDAMETWRHALAEKGIRPALVTMANSAGMIKFPQAHYDAVRPGIALYGIHPDQSMQELIRLQPAMSVKASLVYLREVPAGFTVSYGTRWISPKRSVLATLPIGYADGLPRLLSGRGSVLVHGRHAPIVGTICMDQCVIDVTEIPGVQEYDEAVLLGEQDGAAITAEDLAGQAETIPYEILVRFGQRLPKLYCSDS
jgi:alanine racemase